MTAPDGRYAREFHAGWGTMDFNGHMANTAYLDLAADVRMAFFSEHGFPPAEFRRIGVGPVMQKDELEYFHEVALFETVTVTYAVLAMSPDGARFAPLSKLTDADFDYSLRNKLMGQVNLVRLGMDSVRDGGSFTLTSGVLAKTPMPGSGAISLVNAGVEGFARAAALEAPRGIRVNVVSPPWVAETLTQLGMDPKNGLPAAVVAQTYARAVEGSMTGQVLEATA